MYRFAQMIVPTVKAGALLDFYEVLHQPVPPTSASRGQCPRAQLHPAPGGRANVASKLICRFTLSSITSALEWRTISHAHPTPRRLRCPMHAACAFQYGPPAVVTIRPCPDPPCGPDDLILRSHAATVDSGDARIRAMRMPKGFGIAARLAFGFTKPRQPILGTAVCGEVVRAGSRTTRARVGDRVVAITGMRFGAHAELVRIAPHQPIATPPPNWSAQDAVALVFGGMTALHYTRDLAAVQAGDQVLVHGASGAVGIAAVQIAPNLGAEVHAVCSGPNAELVQSLGAARVIDYTQQDPTREPDRYNVVIDTIGGRTFSHWQSTLRPGGRCALIVAAVPDFLIALRTRFADRRLLVGVAPEREDNLRELMRLAETGALRAVIDSVFPFEDIAHAHARVDSQRKRGSVVLQFSAGT